ncbi:hypothetical protein [Arcticibacter sp. MXS-1]|uniref:hypothetical protein n=1 Tax=Arcticibacter sp. MXS-1 TaxID=3341726 RepID=UPI0035A91396
MKTTFSLLTLVFLCNYSSAQNKWFEVYTDSTLIIKDGNRLTEDLQKKISKIDKKVDLKDPRSKYNLWGPYYSPEQNTVNLSIWNLSPQWYKDFFIDIASGIEQGEKMFGLFFNGFYVPHELGHALQFAVENRAENEYDNEYTANIIGMLYWRKIGKEKELTECYEYAKKALLKMKNPIPENEDVKKYFTEHYSEFGQDPYKYGFIQFSQFVKVYEDNSLPDFDTYIKKFISKQK